MLAQRDHLPGGCRDGYRQLAAYLPRRRNKAGNAGVGGVNDPSTRLYRAQPGVGKMLAQRRRIAKPGIVGDHHDDLAASTHVFPGDLRKY